MQYGTTAVRVGVSLGALTALTKGECWQEVASRLGVSIDSVEKFINGSATGEMAKTLGLPLAAADELARVNGPKGATGLIIGLLFASV